MAPSDSSASSDADPYISVAVSPDPGFVLELDSMVATEELAGSVEEIRQQIASGTYETPEKIQVALDRLMDELSGF